MKSARWRRRSSACPKSSAGRQLWGARTKASPARARRATASSRRCGWADGAGGESSPQAQILAFHAVIARDAIGIGLVEHRGVVGPARAAFEQAAVDRHAILVGDGIVIEQAEGQRVESLTHAEKAADR